MITQPSVETLWAPLELMPNELKCAIMKSLDSFKGLHSLCVASKPYYLIARQQNLFTKTTIRELESRDIHILPRDVVVPKSCTYMYITARISGRASDSCDQSQLAAALKDYYFQSRDEIPLIRVWECYALLSLIDVVRWEFHLDHSPGKLARDVDVPLERVANIEDTYEGRILRPSDPGSEDILSEGNAAPWFVHIIKDEAVEVVANGTTHLHVFDCIDTTDDSLLLNACDTYLD